MVLSKEVHLQQSAEFQEAKFEREVGCLRERER